MNATAPRKLSMFAFMLACEELEGIVTANFERAQRLAKAGKSAEAQRAFAVAESAANKLEALVESQLAAAGEKRPSTAKVDAAFAA